MEAVLQILVGDEQSAAWRSTEAAEPHRAPPEPPSCPAGWFLTVGLQVGLSALCLGSPRLSVGNKNFPSRQQPKGWAIVICTEPRDG